MGDAAEVAFERGADRRGGIAELLVLAVAQQTLHHRVLRSDELQDNLAAELREPGHEVFQRDVPADHQVVNQRQAQDERRLAAVAERQAFAAAPTQAGRRICQVRQ